eukprot:TRINITY_DN25613_c0_g1_i1.p1 TRINITY_DN25613_c0_g1~~TRINITY_DN25613_c0_g1_i1.p1  ORF type:complete len:574 (-),score=91.63 TRINITY_DN25613_c0_g1_i1:474-2195(-)
MPFLQVELQASPPAEEMVMVGSHTGLGWWDPSKGARLVWTGANWATSAGKPVILEGSDTGIADGGQLNYKFVRLGGHQGPRWENGRNRVLDCPPSGQAELLLTAVFDAPASNVKRYQEPEADLLAPTSMAPTVARTTSAPGLQRVASGPSMERAPELKAQYQCAAAKLASFRAAVDVQKHQWHKAEQKAIQEEEALRRELYAANAELEAARGLLASVSVAVALGPERPRTLPLPVHPDAAESVHSFPVTPGPEPDASTSAKSSMVMSSSLNLARRLRSLAGDEVAPPPSARNWGNLDDDQQPGAGRTTIYQPQPRRSGPVFFGTSAADVKSRMAETPGDADLPSPMCGDADVAAGRVVGFEAGKLGFGSWKVAPPRRESSGKLLVAASPVACKSPTLMSRRERNEKSNMLTEQHRSFRSSLPTPRSLQLPVKAIPVSIETCETRSSSGKGPAGACAAERQRELSASTPSLKQTPVSTSAPRVARMTSGSLSPTVSAVLAAVTGSPQPPKIDIGFGNSGSPRGQDGRAVLASSSPRSTYRRKVMFERRASCSSPTSSWRNSYSCVLAGGSQLLR